MGKLSTVKHCFLLTMYGFCSNNSLQSAILSFTMFIFFKILLIHGTVIISNQICCGLESVACKKKERKKNATF